MEIPCLHLTSIKTLFELYTIDLINKWLNIHMFYKMDGHFKSP